MKIHLLVLDSKCGPANLLNLSTNSEANGEAGMPFNAFKHIPLLVILDYLIFQCGTSDVVICVICFGVSFCDVFIFYIRGLSEKFVYTLSTTEQEQ